MNNTAERVETASPTPPWEAVQSYVSQRVHILQQQYLQDVPAARAELAKLRRIDPATSQGVFEFWALTRGEVPEHLIGRGDRASDLEKAIATALHLYAIHQQSRTEPMHRNDTSFGKAMQQLVAMDHFSDTAHPAMKRFSALLTAIDFPEMVHHLRGIVSILRDKRITLHYGTLARDLFLLSLPSARTSVRLRWSRDLIRQRPRTDTPASDHTTATVHAPQE